MIALRITGMLSVLSWSVAYILIIVRGFRDRTFGMPILALCLNISWEFIGGFVFLPVSPVSASLSRAYRILWFALDTVILAQVLVYWRREHPSLRPWQFLSFFGVSLAICFTGVLTMDIDLRNLGLVDLWGQGDEMGPYLSAFIMNLAMSFLFISMIHTRGSVRGQSVYIAVSKAVGSVCANLFFMFLTGQIRGAGVPYRGFTELMWPFFYVSVLILDVTYAVLVYRRCRAEGINPWRRP